MLPTYLRPLVLTAVCCFAFFPWSFRASGHEPADQPSKSVITWNKRDQIAGQVIQAGPQMLQWNTSLFEEPLKLQLDSVRSITWQYDQPAKLPRQAVRVETTQGNICVGELISFNKDFVQLESANFGRLSIPRKNVRSLVNLANSSGRWLGPMSVEDWDADRSSKANLVGNAQGQLVIPEANLVFKKLAVKEKTLIDVAFRWTGAFDMKFGFAVPKTWGKLDLPKEDKDKSEGDKSDADKTNGDKTGNGQESGMVVAKMAPALIERTTRLEMFSDAMVLQQAEQFDVILESVNLDAGHLRMVFEWDPQANQMKAFDASGKLLATIPLNPLQDDFETGLFVLNQSGRLTLDHLTVATLPGELNPSGELIVTKKDVQAGTVEGFNGKTWSIRRALDNAVIEVSRDDFCMTHIPCAANGGEQTGAQDGIAKDELAKSRSTITLRDGSRVTGDFQSIADNCVQLSSDLGTQPVTIRLDRAERIDFPAKSTQQDDASTHVLETAEGRSRGWLSSLKQQSSNLQWQALGSDQPISILSGDFRIQSTAPAAEQARRSLGVALPANPNAYPDQLHLRNGDCFPVRVLRVQSGELLVEAFQRKITFPTHEVVRCVLSVPGKSQSTLNDAPWQKVTTKDKSTFPPNGNDVEKHYACHPSLLETGSFTFVVSRKSMQDPSQMPIGAIIGDPFFRIKLFTSNPAGPGTELYLYVNNAGRDQLVVSVGAEANQFDTSSVNVPINTAIECNIRYVDSEVIGTINGIEALRKKVRIAPDASRGVAIEMREGFEVQSIRQDTSYALSSAFVRSDSREVALTEPRFVSHQPARSLVVGRNGDLWRADIVSMNNETVMVRSGGRHLAIERSLVSSLVWPELPEPEEPPTEDTEVVQGEAVKGEAVTDQAAKEQASQTEEPLVPLAKAEKLSDVQLMMNDGTKLTLKLESWTGSKVIGSSSYYGRMELPTAEIIEVRCGNQIVSAADYEGQYWRFKLGKKLPELKNSPEGGQGGEESAMVGQEAPTFNVKSLDGSDIDLAAYRGKVVVLDFWATWCGYCVEELPGMVAEIGKLPQDKVALITLNQNEDEATIASFMTEKGFKFLVGLDKDQVAPQYKVNGLPTTFVIDPAGKIVHVKIGGGEEPFNKMMEVVRNLAADGGNSAMASAPSSGASDPSSTTSSGATAGKPDQNPGGTVTTKPEMPDSEKSVPQKKALVNVAAHIQPARADQPALLVIQATIVEGHKIFSLTQKAGGPVKTKIKMDASEACKLNDFLSLQEPKKHSEPTFNNMEVEVHQGVVTWYAPLDVTAGTVLESLELTGKVNMQVCNQNNCFAPRDYPFTAKLATSLGENDVIDLSKARADK